MNDTKSCIISFIDQRKTHRKCSKWRPRVSLHSSHRQRNDWRTLSKIAGFVLILSAATTILAMRSSAESTGISYTKNFMCPQKKKSFGLRSGERGGQATSDPSCGICGIQEVPDRAGKVCWGSIVHNPHVSLDGERVYVPW
ncbi:hypothetical protein AVEN_182315-1 [Araneus ventricosus]|uniref:Uncharacterized protein n=1 Tax=Araneus ventricosus TaxID=182803 RepID=A0A4Y2ICN6_ARAVE|nr:hypothetical protein AVEN_182315-1 [Araneus ventricosus]